MCFVRWATLRVEGMGWGGRGVMEESREGKRLCRKERLETLTRGQAVSHNWEDNAAWRPRAAAATGAIFMSLQVVGRHGLQVYCMHMHQ